MATSFDTPAQFERDLRSANKEFKRTKDSRAKWATGYRFHPGIRVDVQDEPLGGSNDTHREKVRPDRPHTRPYWEQKSKSHNTTKMKSTPGDDLTAGRLRGKLHAREEIKNMSRSMIDDMLPPVTRQNSAVDGFLYSFDRAESPARVLSLDVFVKPNTARDTERLVEKEYEILDANGEALKGKRARRSLREGADASNLSEEASHLDEDDFEMV